MGAMVMLTDAVCMGMLATSASMLDGTAAADGIDTAVMVTQQLCVAGEVWLNEKTPFPATSGPNVCATVVPVAAPPCVLHRTLRWQETRTMWVLHTQRQEGSRPCRQRISGLACCAYPDPPGDVRCLYSTGGTPLLGYLRVTMGVCSKQEGTSQDQRE